MKQEYRNFIIEIIIGAIIGFFFLHPISLIITGQGDILSYELKNDITKLFYSSTALYFSLLGAFLAVITGIFILIIQKKNIQLTKHQEELKKLNEDKDRFISILAHDLKSPLSSMLGLVEIMLDNFQKYDLNEIEEYLKMLNESAESTFYLLEEILVWVKTNSGKLPFEPSNINLESIFNKALKILKPTAEKKKISLNLITNDIKIIYADSNMLNTIIRNLISNAIKFTKRGGKINISAEKKDKEVIIIVADNGVGMTKKTLDKLFDITQKVSTFGTENESGTGFGLILCKEFVEIHGGRIWAESKEGKGSSFKFTLPFK